MILKDGQQFNGQACRQACRRAVTSLACAALLVLAVPSTAFASIATEYERAGQAPWSTVESLEYLAQPRGGERTQQHRQRREHQAPTGSCAGAPASRGAGLSRHWNPRVLDDAHRSHNGFGGPLLN